MARIKVSTKGTASLPPFSTATPWHPSKFSLTLDATVFSTKKLPALLQPLLTRSCSLTTTTATMTDGPSLSLFYVLLVGAYTDICMWRVTGSRGQGQTCAAPAATRHRRPASNAAC
jgi:hypothetical protein